MRRACVEYCILTYDTVYSCGNILMFWGEYASVLKMEVACSSKHCKTSIRWHRVTSQKTVLFILKMSLDFICFLALTLDNTLSWRTHIDTIVPKLSSASFAMRVVKPFLSLDSLKMVYYSYFHSVMTYGLIFWGNSHHSNIIFRLQKRIIRIIVGIRGRDSCREHFKNLKILPLQSQFILSLLFLWSIMGIILRWTLRYTTSIQGINRIYICQYLICQYIRTEHITLGLVCSTVSRLK
jgi:hypothetical protein